MIKIVESDIASCEIEVKGNAEEIAQQIDALITYMVEEHPEITARFAYRVIRLLQK